MGCSLAAGGLGSIFGSPADLILIRMQADTTLPVDQQRGYTSFFNAAKRIPAEEGVLSLWKGGFPTVVRAMSLNLGMFTTYEESKERLAKLMPNNIGLSWFLASIFAGSVAATMSLPFDNAKTKMQKMKPDAEGKLPYKNIFDAMGKEVKNNGVGGLWVGLPTYCVRICPHVMITLIISEKLRKALIK
jgi:solute carrier family 25 oxoglutarate transporter 11